MGVDDPTQTEQGVAEVGQEPEPFRRSDRKGRGGPPEERRGGGHVAAVEGSATGRREMPSGSPGESSHVLAGLAELRPVAVGLLEVVTDDLLVLGQALGDGPLEPVGEALVEDRPLGLRERLVGGVADQDVAELEGVAGRQLGAFRADKLLANQGEERAPDLRPERVRRELGHGRLLEHPADDRGPLGDRALARGKALEPGGEQGIDRGRDADLGEAIGRRPGAVRTLGQQAVVDEHPEQLLDVQRVALGGRRDAALHRRRDGPPTRKLRDQPAGRLRAERFEQDVRRVELAAAPAGSSVQQLRAGRAENAGSARRGSSR